MSPVYVRVGVAICLVFVCLQSVSGANILFVSIIPSFSHQLHFQVIWKELSLRGHNVHVITPNPLKDPSLTNLTEYDVSSLYEIVHEASMAVKDYFLRKPDFITVFGKDIFVTREINRLSETAFRHKEVQKLLKEDIKFDVAVIEWLFSTMAGFGAKYKCPIVGITSTGAPLVALDTLGNPSHPITSPDYNLPVTRAVPFRERIMSVLYAVYVRSWYHAVVLPRQDKLVKKYLGNDLPYLGDIERNISILLLNRNPAFHRVMPLVPAIIELGTIKLNRTRPRLGADLKLFLDKSKQGVIYFNLGSNMLSIYLSDNTREMILNVFKQLPYNVIFKWENDSLPGKPDNVYISKWLPQLTILEHPNTKLFITRGGLQSAEEAILAEVPVLGFPMDSDQTANVDTFVKYGVGIALDLDDVTAETFKASIEEIITKPSYKQNAKKLANLMYDRPVDALQRAVWWIEYVIRHKGAKHLRSQLLDIPWWQYFLLDTLGFIVAALALLLLIIFLVFKGIFLLLRKMILLIFPQKNVDKKKKRQ